MRGVFVTGTDTGVGKTVVAALIAAAARCRGLNVAVFKPAVTGPAESTPGGPAESTPGGPAESTPGGPTESIPGGPTESIPGGPTESIPGCPSESIPGGLSDHQMLAAASDSGQSPEEVAPYRFDAACSPHLAAELAGNQIEPAHLQATLKAFERESRTLIVEGIGGLMVPLTPGYLVRDLAVDASLPLVVAARPGLGTINHTLMTLETARIAGLKVAGIVLTPWPDDPDEILRDNRKTLDLLGGIDVDVLPTIPADVLASPTPESLAPLAERSLPVKDWLTSHPPEPRIRLSTDR